MFESYEILNVNMQSRGRNKWPKTNIQGVISFYMYWDIIRRQLSSSCKLTTDPKTQGEENRAPREEVKKLRASYQDAQRFEAEVIGTRQWPVNKKHYSRSWS